jgi:AraC-like DNA-binding protein
MYKISFISNEVGIVVTRSSLDDSFVEHTHDVTEIVIIVKGTALHFVDGVSYKIKAGDVFVINPGTSHEFKNANDFYAYNVSFLPDNLYVCGNEIRKIAGFHILFITAPRFLGNDNYNCYLHLDYNDLYTVTSICEQITTELMEKQDGYECVVRLKFINLITYLSRKYSKLVENDNVHLASLSKAVSYIEKNFKQKITLSDLSNISGYSQRHFTRLFKNFYKMTPSDYIMRLKMGLAINLMINTQNSITEIALECGFFENSHFSNQFKRIMGLTPSEYKKNMIYKI